MVGRTCLSNEVERYLLKHDILHQTTAKSNSEANGKVERVHKKLNEYIRAHITSVEPSFQMFENCVKEAARKLNTDPYKGQSNREKIFNFQFETEKLKPKNAREEYSELCNIDERSWGIGFLPGNADTSQRF